MVTVAVGDEGLHEDDGEGGIGMSGSGRCQCLQLMIDSISMGGAAVE